jgi:hypothetical protein
VDHALAWLNQSSNGLLCISYNRWFVDPTYRLGLQRELGLIQRSFPTESVPAHGFGSSFDGQSMDGRASDMDVLNRWREMRSDPRYTKLFEDRVLADYGFLIFGMSIERMIP